MSQTILLASHDDLPLSAWRVILRRAGYRTACTRDLGQAISLSFVLHPNLIILDHTFSDQEQMAFIDELHEVQPGTYVLCLKFRLTDPSILLNECRSILSEQPSCSRVRSLLLNVPASLAHEAHGFSKAVA